MCPGDIETLKCAYCGKLWKDIRAEDEPEEIEELDLGRVILAENIVEKLNEVIKSVNKLETMNKALKEAIIALATETRPTTDSLKQFLYQFLSLK